MTLAWRRSVDFGETTGDDDERWFSLLLSLLAYPYGPKKEKEFENKNPATLVLKKKQNKKNSVTLPAQVAVNRPLHLCCPVQRG